jgi:hypothetical protein
MSNNGDKIGTGVSAAVALTRCLGMGLVRIFFVFEGEIGLGLDLDLDFFFFSDTIEFGSLYMPIKGACRMVFDNL